MEGVGLRVGEGGGALGVALALGAQDTARSTLLPPSPTYSCPDRGPTARPRNTPVPGLKLAVRAGPLALPAALAALAMVVSKPVAGLSALSALAVAM